MRKIRSNSSLLRTSVFVALLLLLAVVTAPSQSVTAIRSEGERALRQGDYFEAVEFFRRALTLNPNDFPSNRGLAEAYYWLGEYDQAERFAQTARTLARQNPDVLTLSGRIAIGLGDLDRAGEFFRTALDLEPNNADAELGLAELALAGGKSLDAVRALERALQIRPEYRKALLSLVLVYEAAGEIDAAERYLDLALDAHADSPETHILAAEFELRRGDTREAARQARIAQSLDADNAAAPRIRSVASILDGNYAEVIVTSEELLRERRNDAEVWYLRGIALIRTGETDEGMNAFLSALRFAPDNEVIRLVAEEVALSEYPMDAPVRAELAGHVADKAQRLTREFQFRKALALYQRALRLTPFDADLRIAYADLHRTMGHRATYLSELEVVDTSQMERPGLETRIAVYRNALSDSVSRRWGIDQFTIQRERTPIAVYLVEGAEPAGYPLSGDALLAGVTRTIGSLPRVEVSARGQSRDFAAAFSDARSHDVTFFILLRFEAAPRSFGVSGSLYVARTGTPVATISAVRSGPDRVTDVVVAVSRRIEELLPLLAEVIARRGQRLVLDAGQRDGLEEGSELLILPASAVLIEPASLGYEYDAEDVLGTVSVTVVDDLIAEGTVATRGVTDSVVVGDSAIVPGEGAEEQETETLYPVLYDRVRALR